MKNIRLFQMLNSTFGKSAPGQFHCEIALLTRRRQPPPRGVDSDENHGFRQTVALKQGVFQKQNVLEQLTNEMS